MTSNLCGTGKVWVMGFYRDMGYPCKPSQWMPMPKVMGYYRLWVIREMGYDRVDYDKAILSTREAGFRSLCCSQSLDDDVQIHSPTMFVTTTKPQQNHNNRT